MTVYNNKERLTIIIENLNIMWKLCYHSLRCTPYKLTLKTAIYDI